MTELINKADVLEILMKKLRNESDYGMREGLQFAITAIHNMQSVFADNPCDNCDAPEMKDYHLMCSQCHKLMR